MIDSKEELKGFMKASGYVAGELTEVFKDGLGIEDVKSIKDFYVNRNMLANGFNVPGDFKQHLKDSFSVDDLIDIIAASKEGFELGLK